MAHGCSGFVPAGGWRAGGLEMLVKQQDSRQRSSEAFYRVQAPSASPPPSSSHFLTPPSWRLPFSIIHQALATPWEKDPADLWTFTVSSHLLTCALGRKSPLLTQNTFLVFAVFLTSIKTYLHFMYINCCKKAHFWIKASFKKKTQIPWIHWFNPFLVHLSPRPLCPSPLSQ